MKLHMCCAVLVVAGAVVKPESLAAQHSATPVPYSYVALSFTGQHLGRFPAANCSPSALHGLTGVMDFAETTPAKVPAGFGSFDVKLVAACATPFFQALFAREPMTVVAMFVAADGTPVMTYSMKNAQFTRVVLSSTPGSSPDPPYLELSIAAPEVMVAAGGSSSTSGPVPSSSTSGPAGSKSRLVGVASFARVRAPQFHMPPNQLRMTRPLRISGAMLPSAPAASPSGIGDALVQSWSAGGERGMDYFVEMRANLVAGSPTGAQNTVRFILNRSRLTLNAGYAVDGTSHMPTGGLQLSLAPFATPLSLDTAPLSTLGPAHPPLQYCTFTIEDVNYKVGVTIWLFGGKLASYQESALSVGSTSVTVQTFQLGPFERLQISDIGSGKTAQSVR